MSGTKPPPPVPDAIDLFDDDDERTEIATPEFKPKESGPKQPDVGISLDDEDDDERTQIEKKPGPPR
ncbi:MAG: hypothetical protein JST92_24415 [Deltaproteobacteria bacterium]|nr:hypothetical protein [Deltaproteobacteria bacterium]